MVYASYNRGFKSGGYNIASPNVAPFRPETLDDWEAGLKSELFDRRLTFNVNGFLYKYRNMQVIFFPTGGVAGARPVIANRSEEHTSELQSLMRISFDVLCLKKKINTYDRVSTRKRLYDRQHRY